MKTHTDVVLGWNKEGKLEFLKSSDFRVQHDYMMETYELVRTQFPTSMLTSIENLELTYD